jgi:hypothetical protein
VSWALKPGDVALTNWTLRCGTKMLAVGFIVIESSVLVYLCIAMDLGQSPLGKLKLA